MKTYLSLLESILLEGVEKTDRTGTGTRSLFGTMMRFDLRAGFPLITTKRVFWKGVVEELLWLISGDTNVRRLQERGVTIWDEWADENGDLGPVYGRQWREWKVPEIQTYIDTGYWKTIDQLKQVRDRIKTHPDCRRLIVSAWNPADLDKMALAPCHCLFQFSVANGRLSCRLDQRSADMILGVPFNIASYALLTHMMARDCGLEVGDLIWQGGDTHLYLNHIDAAVTQLHRKPRPLPTIRFTDDAPTNLFEIRAEHIVLEGYDPHPAITAPVAV